MHRTLLWTSGRVDEGAQEVLQRKLDELKAEGWQLEGRSYDCQFANRSGNRIIIGIYPTDPTTPLSPAQFPMPAPPEPQPPRTGYLVASVKCNLCGHAAEVGVDGKMQQAIDRQPDALRRRFKCTSCGENDAAVQLIWHQGPPPNNVREIGTASDRSSKTLQRGA
jgi:hypothetical protein